jgi:alpha-galactosidase
MQGDRIKAEGGLEIWAKPLADGAKAVGLFNLSDQPAYLEVNFADLGFAGPVKARDLWAAKDLGAMTAYKVAVPAHGVVMLRVGV